MPRIEFTPHLSRHLDCPPLDVQAETLAGALGEVFAANPRLQGYVLEDQGTIRQHVAIFVDNELIRDRVHWDMPLRPDSRVYVMQALSGG